MKNILAFIILATISFNASAVEVTIGQAQISHFLKNGDDGQELHFNERNEFVDVAFGKDNRIHAFIFENSFGDIAPSVSYDLIKKDMLGLTFKATAGLSYYESNMVDATYQNPKVGAINDNKYEVTDVSKILPTVNLNVEKRIGHLVVGASYGGAYVGTFFGFTF